MRIVLAQINTSMGAIEINRARILDAYAEAARMGADLVVFPEMAVNGYPPRDLLEHPSFIREGVESLHAIAAQMTGPAAILGFVRPNDGAGKPLFNSAALIDGGRVASIHDKTLLPTYDVFDEARHFEPAAEVRLAEWRGMKLAITICEDFWSTALYRPHPLYHRDPVEELGRLGPDLMININASPYSVGKRKLKAKMYEDAVRKWSAPLVVVNQVGGDDNLIFDGWSNVWAPNGGVVAQAAGFREELLAWDWHQNDGHNGVPADPGEEIENVYEALKLGIADYVYKCGFRRVLIGLSGGIDSALTAALAADALGPENVVGVLMPSRFSSDHSLTDAEALAKNLGIERHIVEIEPIVQTFLKQLEPLFAGTKFGLAEENLQARARGMVLMSLSNKFGWLVLSTGNKSELAVGYCTLYGDMTGGLAVLGDVLKTRVWELSRWINRDSERIPWSSIKKAPSAELRENQFDSDSLPPYDQLDPIIAAYVEDYASAEEIVAQGFDEKMVRKVLQMIDRAEYKRQQAAICLKISTKAFGSGRRMPVARGQSAPAMIK
ncbi:NAD+ synthase [bacterium]|nr:NAD+ synthase [bacterium]